MVCLLFFFLTWHPVTSGVRHEGGGGGGGFWRSEGWTKEGCVKREEDSEEGDGEKGDEEQEFSLIWLLPLMFTATRAGHKNVKGHKMEIF